MWILIYRFLNTLQILFTLFITDTESLFVHALPNSLNRQKAELQTRAHYCVKKKKVHKCLLAITAKRQGSLPAADECAGFHPHPHLNKINTQIFFPSVDCVQMRLMITCLLTPDTNINSYTSKQAHYVAINNLADTRKGHFEDEVSLFAFGILVAVSRNPKKSQYNI